jgi:hypothetical protein
MSLIHVTYVSLGSGAVMFDVANLFNVFFILEISKSKFRKTLWNSQFGTQSKIERMPDWTFHMTETA